MALAPALDLRPDAETFKEMPANIEAEQGLLGALLYDNAYLDDAGDLKPHHFHEPFHGRLWEKMAKHVASGARVDPILLAEEFAGDPAFHELGGVRYLADLVDVAPPAANTKDYARVILDCALRRDMIRTAGEIVVSAHDYDSPASDHLTLAEGRLYDLAERGDRGQGFRPMDEVSMGALQMAIEAYSRDGGLAGVSSGLLDLDAKVGGLHPSDLIILAGRPSMGKTALATNIAYNVAKAYTYEENADGSRKTVSGGVVAVYSLEMSGEQLVLRMAADVAGVSGDRIRKGEIDASEMSRVRDAIQEIKDLPLHIDATGGISIAKIAARARRLKRRHGLDLIVIDYIQLAAGTDPKAGKVQEIGQITGGLKALAKDLGVPVIALSQLSRAVEQREDKRPMLSDLRESGSIEQDADMVWFVYREAYYVGRSEPREGTSEHLQWQEDMDRLQGLAEVIVAKQRHGPIGTVKLSFSADTTKFGNLAREHFLQGSRGYRDPTEPAYQRGDT